jgi:hypothetical protein
MAKDRREPAGMKKPPLGLRQRRLYALLSRSLQKKARRSGGQLLENISPGGSRSSSKSDLAMNVFIYVDTSKKVGDPARVPQKKRMRSFSSIERHLPLCSMPPILDKKDLAAAGS